MAANNHRFLIIGAGPAGLGAGWRLQEIGHSNFHVYEANPFPGGLAASYKDDNGFTWDVGGHVLHSHYPYFDTVFETVMKGEYLTHERESWVWIENRFVPYPFQNNIHRLPESVRDECIAGLQKAQKQGKQSLLSFADWIRASFGEGIARHFMLPYNEKVWAYQPSAMNYKWVGDRVANVDIQRIEENIEKNRDDVSWGPNATFEFPLSGGTGAIWTRVANAFSEKISYGVSVTGIDAKKKTIQLSDGSTDSYDALFVTMPLDILQRIVTGIDIPSADPLHFSRVAVVGIGMNGEVPEMLRSKCWMYFPESTAPFFRATVFSNYSPNNAPKGTWSLMTETSSSTYRPLPSGDIITNVIEGAVRTHLLSDTSTIVDTWKFETQHGYPTPTLDRDTYINRVLPLLDAEGIYSRGRFGAWKYEVSNQDHTFMQGVEWTNRMLFGEEEVTVFHPEIVNAKHK